MKDTWELFALVYSCNCSINLESMQKCKVKILQKVIEGFLFLKSFGTKICVCVCVCVCVFCHVQLFATPWTVARQAPLSMEFSGKNTGGIAISCSRASSWLRDWRCFLQWPANTLHRATWEAGTKIHVCISWCLRWHLLCKEGLNGKGHEMVWKVWGDLFLQSGKFHCEL